MRTSTSRPIPAALIAASLAVAIPAPARANVITDWDVNAVAIVATKRGGGCASDGDHACSHVRAVNSIDRRYRPYVVQLLRHQRRRPKKLAAAAAATVLTATPSRGRGANPSGVSERATR